MNKETTAKKIYQAIQQAKKILLVTHYNPDGDAAASVSAMVQTLRSLDKNYDAFCADKFDDKLLFLPGLRSALQRESDLDFAAYDLIITLDCGTLERSRLSGKIRARRSDQLLIEIDHHEPLEQVADWELRLPTAASTTVVIYDWLKINRLPITVPLAEAILAGLAADTGNFLYSSASDRALTIAADLLRRGANWPKLVKAVQADADLASAKLWGVALSRLQVNQRYQVAFTVLTQADFQAAGKDDDSTEGLPGFLSRLNDVKAILVLKESADGVIKGSWRACQEGVDVAKLCAHLGGGGHAKAAGFHFNGHLKPTATGWRVE
jgi:phosphoesterase RecJ-like protein